jgi:hypothetical protein
MFWLAYSGFTASVALSIVFLMLMLGMPIFPALSLAVQTGAVLLAVPAAAMVFGEVRKLLH